jgi:hypothetical protein
MVGIGSAVVVAEDPTRKLAFVTPPNFAPDGRQRPGETLVGMALTPNSLARRKPGVQIPSPPPPQQPWSPAWRAFPAGPEAF